MALDNKLTTVGKEALEAVTEPMEAATARYNADSLAAGKFPGHLTSDSNLRDSAYQLLDQTRVGVDEAMEEVQEAATRQIVAEPVEPVVRVQPEVPSPATIQKTVETGLRAADEAAATGKPATAKAKVAKVLNEVAVAETKGPLPPAVVSLRERALQLVNAPLPKKVKLTKAIEDMTSPQLRKLAAEMGVDITHLGNLRKAEDRELLRSLLQRFWDNPESARVPLTRAQQQALRQPEEAVFKQVPANPHSSIKEMLEDQIDDICNF